MPWKNLKVIKKKRQAIKTLAPENREVSKAWLPHIKKKSNFKIFIKSVGNAFIIE